MFDCYLHFHWVCKVGTLVVLEFLVLECRELKMSSSGCIPGALRRLLDILIGQVPFWANVPANSKTAVNKATCWRRCNHNILLSNFRHDFFAYFVTWTIDYIVQYRMP